MYIEFLKEFMKQRKERPPIVCTNQTEKIPLTVEQKRVWVLYKCRPNSTDYNMCIPLDINGTLNLDNIEEAFNTIIARHDALRISIYEEDDVYQRINTDVRLKIIAKSFDYTKSYKKAAYNWITECSREAFDLEIAPLMKVYCALVNKKCIYLLIVLHHLVSDGWSTGILMKELTEIYNYLCTGSKICLKNPSIQFGDYAIYQKELYENFQYMKNMKAYWIKKIKDIQEISCLYNSGFTNEKQGKVQRIIIPHDIMSNFGRLKELIPDLTKYVCLVGVLRVLLYKYYGLKRIAIGSPLANRNDTKTKDTFGYFADMVMLYTEIKEDEFFVDFLKKEQDTVFESFLYQEMPYEYLVEKLLHDRRSISNPLYQVAISLQKNTKSIYNFCDFQASIVEIQRCGSALDLFFMLYERQGIIDGWVEYNSSIYSDNIVKELIEEYNSILQQVLENPYTKIKNIIWGIHTYRRKNHPPNARLTISNSKNLNLEEKIINIWKVVLENNSISYLSNFFDCNGTSISAMRVAYLISEQLDVDVNVKDIFVYQTPRELTNYIEKEKDIIPAEDYINLKEEISFNTKINVNSFSITPNKTKNILLTGATGFLGKYILLEILKNYDCKIYCIIRSKSKQHGINRIKKALNLLGEREEIYTDRIIPMCGDLEKENLGLDEQDYKFLCENVDLIFHNGAMPNYIASYDSLKKSNVNGTKEIIKIASLYKIKTIHFISTLAIFESDERRKIDEFSNIEKEKHVKYPGYFATKWVAENLIMQARKMGIPCNIYRLGLVLGDSLTGTYDSRQWFYILVKCIYDLGYTFTNMPYLDHYVIPVDIAANNIICLAKSVTGPNKTFHLCSEKRIRVYRLTDKCKELFRYENISLYDWIQNAMSSTINGKEMPFLYFLEELKEMNKEQMEQWIDDNNRRLDVIDSSYTIKILHQIGANCLRYDSDHMYLWVKKILENFKEEV